jgi:hypothetical protein
MQATAHVDKPCSPSFLRLLTLGQSHTHGRYIGCVERKEAEVLLRHWPTGTFAVRKGRTSRVITLKFPVAQDKTFFHVRVTYEEPVSPPCGGP